MPVKDYCSAVWCSAVDLHLKLLDSVVSCASFLSGGVSECNVCPSTIFMTQCRVFYLWSRLTQFLLRAVHCLCRMCLRVLLGHMCLYIACYSAICADACYSCWRVLLGHMCRRVLLVHGGLVAHRHSCAAPSWRNSQHRRTFVPIAGPLRPQPGLKAEPMISCWPYLLLFVFHYFLFFFFQWMVCVGLVSSDW